MNQSTFSDIADALTLDFSVKVNGSKYSLQLKKKRKATLFLQIHLEMTAITFFFIRLIMEEKVAEELNTYSTS